MKYGKDFFDLQLRFARRVGEIAGLPLERAVLDYTNIYVRLAIGRGFDLAHPVWRDYIDGLKGASDAAEWTHRFHLARPPSEPPGTVATFGCFSYALERDDRLRLHFENREDGDISPLGAERVDARRDELRRLFAHVRRIRDEGVQVTGVSWLYNLPAYRRLFPEGYIASAKVAGSRFRNMPLWGQFLDRSGKVKPAEARMLCERVSRRTDLAALALCFPLQPLAVEAPISAFDGFYS